MSFTKLAEKVLIPDFTGKFVHIEDSEFDLKHVDDAGIYLHVPFCHSLCPYCPYDRIFYDKNLAYKYVDAVKEEIKRICSRIGKIRVSSIYIGGGTPTTIAEKLPELIENFRDNFKVKGDVFIETSPYDITDEKMSILKKSGVSMVSIGVQSFQDKFLRLIGRNYDSRIAYKSIRIAQKYFSNINIDLMFALPLQSKEDFFFDLKESVKMGVNQITAYPLFTFPYSTAGKMLKSKRVKLPGFFVRKSMFELMHDYLTENGFYPVSVWGFKKGDLPEFSSVSRLNYIGFGASAATKIKGAFYMNTFSVPHYIEKIGRGEFAEVVKWEFTPLMDDYYYLYWKLYETRFSIDEFNKRFSGNAYRRVHALLRLLLLTGMIKRGGNFYKLTKKGMFYVHLAQNYFSMRYINNVWSEMMHNAEPKEILL